jgi:putative peptidoglycan lipid II flippase
LAETLRSSAKLGVAVLASRILGVGRDALFGGVFGVSWLTDAYFVAFRIPNLLRDLFAEGALSSAFVPTFSDVLANQGRARAFQLANLVLTGALLVTGALALLGMWLAQPIVALFWTGLPPEAAGPRMAALLTRVMMPILVLISVSAVFMGMLNAERRFTAPAYAPALFNLTSITAGLGLWLVGARGERGIVVWSAATTAAAAVQALCQLPSLWSLGFRWRLTLRGLWSDPSVRRIVRMMAPAAIGLAAVQVNVLVATYFAMLLGEGAVSLLSYGYRLFYLPVGVFGVALGVVTSSRIAEEAARGDGQALEERTREGARAAWMLGTASAVGLLVLAEPVITVLFERGMWSAGDTREAVPILRAFVLGVLPVSLIKIYAPGFYALDRPTIPLVASLAAVAVNLAWCGLLYRTLGVAGVALGTTLGAAVNVGILRLGFTRLLGPAADGPPRPSAAEGTRPLLALVTSNALQALVAWGSWRGGVWLCAGADRRLHGGLAGLWLALAIALGFLTYALALRAWRYPGAEELLGIPARVLDRLRGGNRPR